MRLAPLWERFRDATILICADHQNCRDEVSRCRREQAGEA